jgi:DNA-binding PadR family transcriptional regulator
MARGLTELENCTLGVVWLRGPCTAYAVRKEFTSSVTPHWSASAGSIYPVLERLHGLSLIRAVTEPWGEGTRKQYEITPAGLEALRGWIGPPLQDQIAAPTFDPIRTRMFFLEALPPAKRAKFIDEAEEATLAVIGRLRRSFGTHLPSADDTDGLASLGTVYQLQARLRWLRRVRRILAGRG